MTNSVFTIQHITDPSTPAHRNAEQAACLCAALTEATA